MASGSLLACHQALAAAQNWETRVREVFLLQVLGDSARPALAGLRGASPVRLRGAVARRGAELDWPLAPRSGRRASTAPASAPWPAPIAARPGSVMRSATAPLSSPRRHTGREP